MRIKCNKKLIFILLVLMIIVTTIVDLTFAQQGIKNYGMEVIVTIAIVALIMILLRLLHVTDFLIKHHILDEKKKA